MGVGVALLLHPFFLSSSLLLVPRSGTSEGRAVGQIGRRLGSSSSSCPTLLCDLRRVPCLLWVLEIPLNLEVGMNILKVSQLLGGRGDYIQCTDLKYNPCILYNP